MQDSVIIRHTDTRDRDVGYGETFDYGQAIRKWMEKHKDRRIVSVVPLYRPGNFSVDGYLIIFEDGDPLGKLKR